jgi:hypothetical protein
MLDNFKKQFSNVFLNCQYATLLFGTLCTVPSVTGLETYFSLPGSCELERQIKKGLWDVKLFSMSFIFYLQKAHSDVLNSNSETSPKLC